MDDVQDALKMAEAQLTMIGTLYEADLELQRVSPTLRGKIRAFLDTERLALDQLAAQVSGVREGDTRYPLAPEAEGFEASLGENMPGVLEDRPDVAATVARHQPYCVAALGQLRELLQDEKRQRLTARSRPAPKEVDPPTPPEPLPTTAPPSGGLKGGLTGPLFINGVEYDSITLKPLNPLLEPRRESIYVDWLFEGGDTPALQAMEAIHAAVIAAVTEVSAASSR